MNSLRFSYHAPGVLPRIAKFHELQVRRHAGLTKPEQRELDCLREMFEPVRLAGRRVRRQAIRLSMRRKARLIFDGALHEAVVNALSLRALEVVFSTGELPLAGRHIWVNIENAYGDTWYPFVARVAEVVPGRRRVTLQLERPLKPQAVLTACARVLVDRPRDIPPECLG